MKVATLYLLTAVVTGLHNTYGVMDMVNGAPINVLNCVSLLGSLALLAAAFLALWKPHFSAVFGIAGSLLSWVFYAPLLFISLLMPFSAWSDVQSFFHFREYVPLAGMFFGPILLIACTVNSTLVFRRTRVAPE